MNGKVAAFDEHRGIGTIAGEDGRDYPFHCTQIANGSRTVALNAMVTFEIVPGHLGRWEAAAITPQ